MKTVYKSIYLLLVCLLAYVSSFAQYTTTADAKVDATNITVGDQVRLFLEVTNDPQQSKLLWAVIPDSFNHLEVVEKGKIDTIKQNGNILYRQRLLVTGFDSGRFFIPSFSFTEVPLNGSAAKALSTDSIPLVVQTVPVDTTKGFKGIKGIMQVKTTWMDYLWIIIGAALFIGLAAFVLIYFLRNKKTVPPVPEKKETQQEAALRMLDELEQKQLWQNKQVKEYYVELTDILRAYIEERFHTPALELTTDELLETARINKEMQPYANILDNVLYTADLAKFARAEPMPHEHMAAMENARQFIKATTPVIVTETAEKQ